VSRTAQPVLEVADLKTHFFTRDGVAKAVDGVTFHVSQGEILGIVGESGSGKSVTGFSILGLVDPPGRVVSGSVKLKGEELVGASEEHYRRIRGRRIAMIFQDPMMTLNPVIRVGTQITEAIQAHEKTPADEARRRARDALATVGIPSPEERLDAYPHQLSGGMRQRVAIAIALVNRPELIIADEPTTALDVTIQGQILAEVQKLARSTGTALVWITHDLGVVAGLADRIAVMYAGRVVEQGSVDDILEHPMHRYTEGLLGSLPTRNKRGERLVQIPGMAPSLLKLPPGCAFQTRCPRADATCRNNPPVFHPSPGREHRCFHPAVALASAAE
jgi:peptide/nickel transport system ATP-binding protein